MINYTDIAKTINTLDINHPIWIRTLELAYARIALAAPGQVVCVIGPPRVGKSRMSSIIRSMLNLPGIGIDDPQSLSIGVRASNCSTNGAFSTKDFARKAVVALNHPILSTSARDDTHTLIRQETEGAYWLALERGLPAAGKRYLFIDEAQNICRAKGRNGAGSVLDAWKCVAEDTGVVLVLTGTYELHNAMQNSTHMLGRKSFVHFPRYRVTREDILGFHSILQTYAGYLPLAPELENIHAYSEYLYTGSLGCIGLLERWFRDALGNAMVRSSPIDLRALEESRACDTDLAITLEEIVAGEEMMAASGIEIPALKDTAPSKKPEAATKEQSSTKQTRKPRDVKPFACKPVRRTAGERVPGDVHV